MMICDIVSLIKGSSNQVLGDCKAGNFSLTILKFLQYFHEQIDWLAKNSTPGYEWQEVEWIWKLLAFCACPG